MRFFPDLRRPLVSDIFYPGDYNLLTQKVQSILSVSDTPGGNAWAVVAPHAGYEHCGRILGSSWSAVADRNPKGVILIASTHGFNLPGVFLPRFTSFITPLGDLLLDKRLSEALAGYSEIIIPDNTPHCEEHSLEVHFPFIRFQFPGVPVCPLLLGKASEKEAKITAEALLNCLGKEIADYLIIFSANFSQFLRSEQSEVQANTVYQAALECKKPGSGFSNVCAYGPLSIIERLSAGLSLTSVSHGLSAAPKTSTGYASGKCVYYGAVSYHIK